MQQQMRILLFKCSQLFHFELELLLHQIASDETTNKTGCSDVTNHTLTKILGMVSAFGTAKGQQQ